LLCPAAYRHVMSMDGTRVDGEMVRAMGEQVRALSTRLHQMTGALSGIQEKIQELSVTAVSRDGLVRVTVGSDGKVRDLQLDSRIYHSADSAKLASTIVDTMTVAAQEAREQVLDICRPHIPTDALEQYASGDFTQALTRFRQHLPQIVE
jgi:DNA-binding protein YbaB